MKKQQKWYGHPKTSPEMTGNINRRVSHKGLQIEITKNPIYHQYDKFFATVYDKKGTMRIFSLSGKTSEEAEQKAKRAIDRTYHKHGIDYIMG